MVERTYQEVPSNFFVSVPKIFVAEPFILSLFSGLDFFLLRRVRLQFSVENFLSHGSEYFRRETFPGFGKVPVLEKITNKRGGEKHDFASKLFFLNTKLFRTGTILCFRNDRVTKTYCPRGDHHDFLSRKCCSKVPKVFVGEPFRLSLHSAIENFFAQQG